MVRNAKTTVYAHHLAFTFFGGIPTKMIYDQDRKMLVKENFGDYLMTEEFARYVAQSGFTPVFCMPFDPASKGLSEATVKYVKGNFLPGRQYSSHRPGILSPTPRFSRGTLRPTPHRASPSSAQRPRFPVSVFYVNTSTGEKSGEVLLEGKLATE